MARTYNLVSPHLDDAVLSCGRFLAANPGSRITTVFAAGPPSVRPLPPWDRAARCFADGDDVMRVRREEDDRAAALIHATTVHLPFWDRQYRTERHGYTGPGDDELTAAVARDLLRHAQRDAAWVIPLGLGHRDHRITADAGLILAGYQPGPVYLYEELPYTAEKPAEAAARRSRLTRHGFTVEPDPALEFAGDRALKRAAFRCHASQRRPLRWRAWRAFRTPERVWRLVRC